MTKYNIDIEFLIMSDTTKESSFQSGKPFTITVEDELFEVWRTIGEGVQEKKISIFSTPMMRLIRHIVREV